MAKKPEVYKEKDAVKLRCERSYTTKTANEDDAVTYDKGKEYSVAPRSAQHLLRKMYRVFEEPKDGQRRGRYIGDAPHFVDVAAEKAEAEKKKKAEAEAAKAAKSDDE